MLLYIWNWRTLNTGTGRKLAMMSPCIRCSLARRGGAVLVALETKHVDIDDCISVLCKDTLHDDAVLVHGVR